MNIEKMPTLGHDADRYMRIIVVVDGDSDVVAQVQSANWTNL
jgi:hypothetical protein